MIISFINLKGGVGKSTLCANVAGEIARSRRQPVLIVDLDPQQTSRKWYERRKALKPPAPLPITVSFMNVEERWPTKDFIRSRSARYEYVLLDGAAGDMHISSAALNMSDLVVLPCMPDQSALEGTDRTIEFITRPPRWVDRVVPSVVAITSFDTTTAIQTEYANRILPQRWPGRVLRGHVRELIAFEQAMARGLTVAETEPGGNAASDIRALTDQILKRGA